MDETSEWCNSFVLVPKGEWQSKTMFIKQLIRPVHRGATLNDILPRLSCVKYHTLTYANSGCHNLKLDGKSSYLTNFSCPFGRYQYIQLPFGESPVGDIFQKKIDELFSGMSNVFHIADGIMIAGFDESCKEHDETLEKVLLVCRQVNLKLNKSKCLFWCTNIPFFAEIVS